MPWNLEIRRAGKHSEQLLNSPAKSRKWNRPVLIKWNAIFHYTLLLWKLMKFWGKDSHLWKLDALWRFQKENCSHDHFCKIKNERTFILFAFLLEICKKFVGDNYSRYSKVNTDGILCNIFIERIFRIWVTVFKNRAGFL